MVSCQDLCVVNRCLFARRQELAVSVLSNIRGQSFCESLFPCQGKPGIYSKVTLIFLRHLETCQLGQLHVDTASCLGHQRKIKIDERLEHSGSMSKNLDKFRAAQLRIILTHN